MESPSESGGVENVFSDMMKAGKVGCLLLVCLSLAVMTTALGDSTGDLASASVRLIRSEGAKTYKKTGGHFRRRGDKKERRKFKKWRKTSNEKRRKGEKKRVRGKKNENSKKRKNTKNKKNTRAKVRSDSISSSCFQQSITIMKMWKDVISNFEKQKKRMEKQNGTGGNKSGKKGVFAPTARRLLNLGGGNKSEFSCAGRTDNNGAQQLKNLTDTLFDCEEDVHEACNPSTFPQELSLLA